ncbi:MAG: hypothetical protein ACK55Z_07665, partial [bacterium]
ELIRNPSSAATLKFQGMTSIMADLMALKASWNSNRSVKSSASSSTALAALDDDWRLVMLLMLNSLMESLDDAGFASSIHPRGVMYPASPIQAIS